MHYNHLTREQRYAIYPRLQEGKSRKAIARQIKVHPSTVGREIRRNSTRFGHYSWRIAQESADIRKERLPGNRGIDCNILKEALHLLKTEDRSPRQMFLTVCNLLYDKPLPFVPDEPLVCPRQEKYT